MVVKNIFAIVIIGVVFLAACSVQNDLREQSIPQQDNMSQEQDVSSSPVGLLEREVQELADGTKYIIHPDEIVSGGPPQDGIPSIDEPVYVSVEEADEWVEDDELVLAFTYKNVTRVYPLQIMVWHEIVNDVIAGDPILVTYCPLCMTGIAYHGLVDGERSEFGTTGKLWNSNLVMYDRNTDSYWTQIAGLAIKGERTGDRLEAIGVDTVAWGDWKKRHPNSEVLSQDTGFSRDYGRDPYGNYYVESTLFFPVDDRDDRIFPKDVIYGVELGDELVAYREDDIKEQGRIEDVVGGIPIVVEIDDVGVVTVVREDTGEEVARERGFWFSWYAFHPTTRAYGIEATTR